MTTENFLEGCLFFNANALSRSLLKIAESEFKALKISPAHASFLLVVYDNPGISPKQISSQLNLTPSTISRFLESLVKKRLLTRTSKGKSAFIFPTNKGLELQPDIALAYKNLCLKYVSVLGKSTAEKLACDLLDANQLLADRFDEYEKKL